LISPQSPNGTHSRKATIVDIENSQGLRKLEALAARPGTAGEGEAARAAIERIRARQRPPAPPTIVGLHLILDRTCDRRSPCCDRHGIVGPGVGPHRYSLRCAQCEAHRGWIKSAAADLMEAMRADGRLSSSPILREMGVVP
jgi:hypothetical protein